MKKLICLLLVVIIICPSLYGCDFNFVDDSISNIFTTQNEPEIEWEKKVYWDGDPNCDFKIGVLFVVLDKAISVPNKVWTPDFFVGVDVVSVYDCTKITNFDNIPDDWHQILYLTLAESYNTKEKTLEAMRILAPLPGILSVSPSVNLTLDTSPNDPLFDDGLSVQDQWGHEHILIEKVWDFTTGAEDLRIGVLDTGISSHDDLNGNYSSSNAADFYDATQEQPIFVKLDEDGHGTHVAGIIGAVGNNNTGICGINWNISVMQLRAVHSSDNVSIVNAINWAANNNIPIINFSAGANEPIPGIETAIRDYCNRGGLFICSTGNKKQDNDIEGQYQYPSFYGSDLYENKINNMISVGRINVIDLLPNDANWGSETIDIYAPGQKILSTFPIDICINGYYMQDTQWGEYRACECEYKYYSDGDGPDIDGVQWVPTSEHKSDSYHYMSSSSMSTPYVTGVAALLLSVNPNLTASQIENCIINGANTITIETYDGVYESVKRLNAWGAFKYLMNNYPIYERNIGYVDGTGSYNIDADAPYMKDNTMMVKYNIQNPGSYTFTLSANSPIEVKLYNSNLEEIVATQTQSNNGCEIEFTHSLSASTYYIKTNYISDDAEGTISVEIECPPHTHEYSEWAKHTSTHHIECCSLCDQKGTATSPHVIKVTDTLFSKANCMFCGQWINLDDTIVMVPGVLNIQKVTVNGSYILPNGIIVLVDEDIEAYLNGTLVFYDKDDLPQTQ